MPMMAAPRGSMPSQRRTQLCPKCPKWAWCDQLLSHGSCYLSHELTPADGELSVLAPGAIQVMQLLSQA